MRHEFRIPLRDSIDNHTAPIMAADHNSRDVELGAERGDGVRVGFVGEVLQGRGCGSFAISHAVQGYAAEPQREENGDLVTPGEGYVREAVD